VKSAKSVSAIAALAASAAMTQKGVQVLTLSLQVSDPVGGGTTQFAGLHSFFLRSGTLFEAASSRRGRSVAAKQL